jgi:branched-subunit amino acid transport protein AzlD
LTLLIFLILIACIPLYGFLILRNTVINPGIIAWTMAIAFILSIYFYVDAVPLVLMFLYITGTFLSLKIVVAHNHLARDKQLNFSQWLVFCYLWFGMNPLPFKQFPSKSLAGYSGYLRKGLSRIIIGLLLIAAMDFIFSEIHGDQYDYFLHLTYLIALSLILHFGLLQIATGNLRYLGVPVTLLFKDPIRSKSLDEFWGKRWNVAFVELTTIAVLRPLKKRFGNSTAFWASFIFSGLLHELAISLPVKSGFGRPLLYFFLQAFLIIVIEKRFLKNLSSPILKSLWVLACLLLPVFLLFHEQFIRQIIIPLAQYLNVFSYFNS